MINREQLERRFRVLGFLAVTLATLLAVTLLIGRSQGLFTHQVTLHTSFDDVGGMVTGTEVRLAGVNVGIVRSIHFSSDPRMERVAVDLAIGASYLPRIHQGATARMGSKGLLGDLIIDLTPGDKSAPSLSGGELLPSVEAPSMAHVLDQAEQAFVSLNTLATDADERLKAVLTPELASDLHRLTAGAGDVLQAAQNGPGVAHELLMDPGMAEDARAALHESRRTAVHLARAAEDLQRLTSEVEHGDGVLHGLVHGKGGARTAAQLQQVTDDLQASLSEIREGNGIAHSLIYEEQKTNLVEDLSEAARIVRVLAEETDQGKGTVGGLLKDPTAYEDLTTLLGDVRRNALLRALIRFTIRHDGLVRPHRALPAERAPANPEEKPEGAPP